MSGKPLGGVGDLYAILGASAYLGAQLFKGVGRLTNPWCPIDGLEDLVRDVFMEVAVDVELENELWDIACDPETGDDIWDLAVEVREMAKGINSRYVFGGELPYETMKDIELNAYPPLRDAHTVFRAMSPIELKRRFPVHIPQDDEVARNNQLIAIEQVMRVWHHRYPAEVALYYEGSFYVTDLIKQISMITHHERKAFELRKVTSEHLDSNPRGEDIWLDSCWKRIEELQEENGLFYQLIHDHPVYSYRNEAYALVSRGNDGFTSYNEYPTCWDYVGTARPSLDNPVNKEHFILMLMATYRIVPEQVDWFEIFDVEVDTRANTVTWRYFSKNGTIQNWIRGEDWQNELKTTEEKELEHEEFLERTDWALSNRFDL